jgi:chloride channel 3/4/5
MNFQSRSTSLSTAPQAVRRPSVSSRLSSAVSIAERGEPHNGDGNGDGGGIAAQHQIEEEIAKIKRYEVGRPPLSRLYAMLDGPDH